MAEYIEREALIDWLTTPTGFKTNCEDCTSIDCLDCIVGEAIQNLPAADVDSVQHGRWSGAKDHGEFREVKCTACGGILLVKWSTRLSEYRYCPNCGARMDGE